MLAKFIGADRSMGYRNGQTYKIRSKVKVFAWGPAIQVSPLKRVYGTIGPRVVCYDSIEKFLENWQVLLVDDVIH